MRKCGASAQFVHYRKSLAKATLPSFVCLEEQKADLHTFRPLSKSKSSPALCTSFALASVQSVTGAKREFQPPTLVQRRCASSQPKPKTGTHYYDVLEVSSKASQSDIKSAYYRLSKVHHPDVNKSEGAQQRFSEISEAYEILGNSHKRRLYDRGAFGGGHHRHHSAATGEAAADEGDYTQAFRQREGFGANRPPPRSGRTWQYNYDEFYRQHYTENIRSKQAAREEYEEAVKQYEIDRFGLRLRGLTTVFMFLGMLFIFFLPPQDPVLRRPRSSDSDKKK